MYYRRAIGVMVVASLIVFASHTFAQERMVITTYYPSPVGSYNELTANQMKIGTTYSNAAVPFVNDSLIIEGSVGIGTSTPSAKMSFGGRQLIDFDHNTSSEISGNIIGALGFWGYGVSHGQFHYRTGKGFEMLDVSADGPSVGHASTRFAPAYLGPLYSDVGGEAGSETGLGNPGIAQAYVANSGANVGIYIGNGTPFGQSYIEQDGPPATHIWVQEGPTNVFNVAAGGKGYFAGSLGIGTAGPISLLHLFGAGDVRTYVQSSSTSGGYTGYGILDESQNFRGGMFVENSDKTKLNLWNLGAKVMTLDSSGNVGIGTVSPLAKFHVVANGGFGQEPIRAQSSSTFFSGVDGGGTQRYAINNDVGPMLNFYGWDANWFNFMSVNNMGTRVVSFNAGKVGIGEPNPSCTLTVNGSAWCSSGSWAGSDLRWKRNIQGLSSSGALDKLLRLRGVEFEFRQDEFKDLRFPAGKQVGLIAQEVEKEFPELVTTNNAGYKGIAYDRMTAVLLEAIKEQQKEIKKLKEEVAALQKKVR